MRKTLVCLIMLGVLAACSDPEPPPEYGVITDMNSRAAWSQWVPGSSYQTCTGTGTNRRCTTHTNPGHTIQHPADYDVIIEGVNEEGEPKTYTDDVSSEEYDAAVLDECWSTADNRVVDRSHCLR